MTKPVPPYFDEKRYSYHVLAPHPPPFGDYQQADPTTGFEKQIQSQYIGAYASLQQQKYSAAHDAFQQLQSLILTTVHPSLPLMSYATGELSAPLDPALVDTLATKVGAALQANPITTFAFPKTIVAEVAPLPPAVAAKLAPLEGEGLRLAPAVHPAAPILVDPVVAHPVGAPPVAPTPAPVPPVAEPGRTYSIVSAKGSLTLSLAGDVVQNVHGFLQALSDTKDIDLLHSMLWPVDATRIVAYLPSMYFFVIPMAIGDCLAGLGNLEQAASTYASVLVYPYINKALEIPKLWTKLATVYLEMGDRDYRNAGDDPTLFGAARAGYEQIIKTDDSLDATSPLWADARFAVVKQRVTAFAAAGFPGKFADNPNILSKVLEARTQLRQIKAGLDFFGHKPDYLPPFGWEYLQNIAKYFAQQASQMEQRYLQYTSSGEAETLQRQELDQQAQVAGQTVVLEQQGKAEAQAAVTVANAGLTYANVQAQNAQQAKTEFAKDRAPLAEYDLHEAWANAASVDQGSEVSLTISGYTYYNVSGERRSEVIKDLEAARTKISQDEEASQLQRSLDAANAYATEAQAQVADAEDRVDIAKQRVALAQLQQQDAQENRDYLDTQELNARLWFELAGNARKISQRYTVMATGVAKLAERAYNAETGRNLTVIRDDYTHSATDNLMGADFLALDLDFFTYDYVTTTKTKKAPVKRVISLADNYPNAFNQLRATGRCMFQTELAMLDRQTPGLYLCKTRNVELVFVGITRANIAGTLRNIGASRFRQGDGSVVTRFYPADVMPLSSYDLRQDALAFRVNPNDLQLFENHGVDTLWQIDMPLSANDIDFGAVIDVQLVLYYDGFFDPLLEAKIQAGLPKSSAATRVTSMALTFPDELFYLKSNGTAQLVCDATLFPRMQTNLKRVRSSLRVSGDAAAIKGITLHVASAVLGKELIVKTDDNGVVPGTAAPDPLSPLNGQPVFDTLAITIKPDDNPQLVAAGKLDLSGITDLMTYVQYTFDYR